MNTPPWIETMENLRGELNSIKDIQPFVVKGGGGGGGGGGGSALIFVRTQF